MDHLTLIEPCLGVGKPKFMLLRSFLSGAIKVEIIYLHWLLPQEIGRKKPQFPASNLVAKIY